MCQYKSLRRACDKKEAHGHGGNSAVAVDRGCLQRKQNNLLVLALRFDIMMLGPNKISNPGGAQRESVVFDDPSAGWTSICEECTENVT